MNPGQLVARAAGAGESQGDEIEYLMSEIRNLLQEILGKHVSLNEMSFPGLREAAAKILAGFPALLRRTG